MVKNVELNLQTWQRMKGALGSITETSSGVSDFGGGSYSSQGGPAMSSYSGVGGGSQGFSKRISDLVDIAKKAERLIASKDSDGAISFSYYEHQAPAIQLQGKLQALQHYAANVDKYITDKIDHPFYVKMDKVIYDLEQLNILDYKTTNRIGYQTTMTITDADGKRTTLPYQPSEIGLLELYKVDNPYKRSLQASFTALMDSAEYGSMHITQDDYLVQGLQQFNFSYDSLYESQQALENLRDVVLTAGAFVTYLFCPPAGAALFLALSGADLYSALSGQDWSTGRELETSERWMRGIFAAIDFIPGSDVFKAFKANGFKAAGLEYMQDLLGISTRSIVKGGSQVDGLIAISDDLSEQVLKGVDPYGKQLDNLGLRQADDVIDSPAKNFSLNEPLADKFEAGASLQSGDRLKAMDSPNQLVDRPISSTVASGVEQIDDMVDSSARSFSLEATEVDQIDDVLDFSDDTLRPLTNSDQSLDQFVSSHLDNLSDQLDDGLVLRGDMPDKLLVNVEQLDGVEAPGTTFNLNNPQGSATEVPSIKEPPKLKSELDVDFSPEPPAGATKIIHKDGRVEIVGEGEITNVIDNRPYLNPKNRPSFRKGVVEQVYADALKKGGGVVRDPLTDEIIIWEPGQPRKGVWDMGHVRDQQYADVHKRYVAGEMTPAQFRDWYNDPIHYRPELPSSNSSRILDKRLP